MGTASWGFWFFGGLMKNTVRIGILYSTTGPYAEIGPGLA
jgi:hypothetical protein